MLHFKLFLYVKTEMLKIWIKNKNVKEGTLFNIISEKPEKSTLLKKAKMPQTKKC